VAMPTARVEIVVDGPAPGDDIEFRLSANPGIEPAPIAKAASGGELSRMMLALHLELAAESPTLIFDEIDAGIGGAAATSVGRALAELATDHQVIVVTHQAQVAAYANAQLAVTKVAGELSVSTIATLDDAARVVELSRMLSGQPESETARRHAEELLSLAGADRGRS
jgi:DNA repair protein RecN (Recombination protein N)